MKWRTVLAGVAGPWLLAACGGPDRAGDRAWHEPPPPSVVVALRGAGRVGIAYDKARSVPTPTVRFPALVQADPNHASPVRALAMGVLVRVHTPGVVRRGDTLAVIGQGSDIAGRLLRVPARRAGSWEPRRQTRQLVWQDDTIGLLEEHEYWLAVGAVSDIEAGPIDPRDPAAIHIYGDDVASRAARIEWVRPPGREHPYSAEIAVHFRAPSHVIQRTPVVTIVVKAGSEDTTAALPASAVVRLPLGPAVFVPVDSNLYEVRWVTPGPSLSALVVVRDGIEPGTTVVSAGLGALMTAARESLAQRGKPSAQGGQGDRSQEAGGGRRHRRGHTCRHRGARPCEKSLGSTRGDSRAASRLEIPDFRAHDHLDAKRAKRLDRFSQLSRGGSGGWASGDNCPSSSAKQVTR